MREVRIQKEVPAPPEAVWAVFANYRGWVDWSGVKEVVLRSEGRPAPYGVGAACVVRARGIAIEEEITHFEPPHRLGYRIIEGLPLRSHSAEVVFVGAGEGTQVVWRVEFSPWVPGTGPWIASLFERELLRILDRLAAYPFERASGRTASGSAASDAQTRDLAASSAG